MSEQVAPVVGNNRKRPPSRRSSNWEKRGRHRRGAANKRARTAIKPSCSECNGDDPKYKCPKCRAAYCSVACCKTHKEKSCKGTEIPDAKEKKSKYLPDNAAALPEASLNNTARRSRHDYDDDDLDEGWILTDQMKTLVQKSPWLKKELQDGGLRQVICQIDGESNLVQKDGATRQEHALEQAKQRFPHFSTFVDKLLVTAGVLERGQQGEEVQESLEEWLERDGTSEELGSLVLTPIARKQRLPIKEDDLDSESDSGGVSITSSSSDTTTDSDSSDSDTDSSSD